MIELFEGLLGVLPPLRRKKRPNVAAFVGTLGGPILLPLYLGSFIDFVVGLIIYGSLLLIGAQLGEQAVIGFGLIAWGSWGLWGYLRVSTSNRQLAAASPGPPVMPPAMGKPATDNAAAPMPPSWQGNASASPSGPTANGPSWWAEADPAPPGPSAPAERVAPAPSAWWTASPTGPDPAPSHVDGWWTAGAEDHS